MPDDYQAILNMAAEFWLETQFDEPFEREHTLNMVRQADAHKLLAVIDNDGLVGFSAGVKSFCLASSQSLIGLELAWWVMPAYRGGASGVKLLKFMERLAREQGIKYWNMLSMETSNPDYVNRLYERLGYLKSETTWTKVLN